jgi:hypothetical protein
MVAVQATTEQVPVLAEEIEYRRRDGRDIYDEWRNGVYWLVDVPPPECGELLVDLAVLLHPLAEAAGLHTASPVNIGIDREDCRTPNLGVYRPGTLRTSPAFLETAVLVVEVLAPGEASGANLGFYKSWGVQEHLEVNWEAHTVSLLVNVDRAWELTGLSPALGFDVIDSERIVTAGGELDLRDYG